MNMVFHDVRATLSLMVLTGVVYATGVGAADLSGAWWVRLDPKDQGITNRWFAAALPGEDKFLPFRNGGTIMLPTTLTRAGYGEKTQGASKGCLTATYSFANPAWYQREIEISPAWAGRRLNLHLERVLWRSTVWVDDQQAGAPVDCLGVPHDHDLGVLAPGTHRLTVRIDNRAIIPEWCGHHYYYGMQTIWNGIVGRIEINPSPAMSLVRLFPSYKDATIVIEVTTATSAPVTATIRDKATGGIVAQETFTPSGPRTIKLSQPVKPWDEFTPNLYTAEIKMGDEIYRADIGFRDLGKTDYHLTINGRPFLWRSNHDGCMFPLTGHPPVDVEGWRRVLRVYKAHGLNAIRFHSWTPPEAAFTAADELGIYIQAEHAGGDMTCNPKFTSFVRQEMRASLDHYGNHPSMVLNLYGNENPGSTSTYSQWLNEDRAYDPRHLYSGAGGRPDPYQRKKHLVSDDCCEYGAKMNWAAPLTDWDYSEYYIQNHVKGVPEFCHEMGQPVTHPDWRQLAKYTGILQPRNYELAREAARAVGIEDQSADFEKASGNIARLNYKLDIEATLRTPQSAGYGLLDMHDYPGQGEALVGWLDAFYDEKGFLTAKEFNQYGGATVPLARLPKFVFTDGETLDAKAELAHYGPADLKNAVMAWSLTGDDGHVAASGRLLPKDAPVGAVTPFGEFKPRLESPSPRGAHYMLVLSVRETPFQNNWDIWVFPKAQAEAEPTDVLVLDDAEAAVKALDGGRKVLLLANRLGKGPCVTYACFKPIFWSTDYGFAQRCWVTGAVVKKNHPALALFPTEDVLDLQWQPLCSDFNEYSPKPASWVQDYALRAGTVNGRGFDLKGYPASYRPIVQPVSDFKRPVRIGTIFEMKTRNGGRLLVSGYDLAGGPDTSPPARQLRKSLLTYMASDRFAPECVMDNEWILSTFAKADRPVPMPTGYENAYLYIKAGARHPTRVGEVECDPQWDDFSVAMEGLSYKVSGARTLMTPAGAERVGNWAGKNIRVEIRMKEALSGILKVRFQDLGSRGRRGVVRSEDGQKQELGAHEKGVWLEFPIRREDSLDGLIKLEADITAGPNLMITDIAFVPRN